MKVKIVSLPEERDKQNRAMDGLIPEAECIVEGGPLNLRLGLKNDH